LSSIENFLGAHGDDNNNDDHEHAAKVTRFVTVLALLSEGGIRVLHEMTEGPMTEVGIDNENAGLSALINDMTDRQVTEVVFINQNAGLLAHMNVLAGLWALFVTILAGLSVRAIGVLHEMTEAPSPGTEDAPLEDENAGLSAVVVNEMMETAEVVLDNENNDQDTSSYHTALSVVSSCATTAQCTDSAAGADEADSGDNGFVFFSGNEDDSDTCGCCGLRW
jgi:hypothetical protein